MNQQPGGIAAGAFAFGERLFRRPHAGFHAYNVGNAFGDQLVKGDKLVDIAQFLARNAVDQRLQQWAGRLQAAERGEFFGQDRIVGERPALGVGFEKEVEGVDRRHVGDEVDGDVEAVHLFGEHDAGHEIALGILKPVQEVRLRFDLQRV